MLVKVIITELLKLRRKIVSEGDCYRTSETMEEEIYKKSSLSGEEDLMEGYEWKIIKKHEFHDDVAK